MKRNEGITLIALIITIIILIILTAITINNVISTNLFGLAKGATENYIHAGQEEQVAIDSLVSAAEEIENGLSGNSNNNVLNDFTNNPDKYEKPDNQTETEDVGISEDGTVLNMDLWNYEINEKEGSFDLTGVGFSGSLGCPAFTFKPVGDRYEGIEITTNAEGKRVATFEGGIPTYLRRGNGVYFLDALGEMAFDNIPSTGLVESLRDPEILNLIQAYNFDELEITIPSTVSKLGEGAFSACGVENIKIPSNVREIGKMAFAYCSSLSEITIPSGIGKLELGTFGFCTSLEQITIPDSVLSIDEMAFAHCSSLETINYRGTAEQWKGIEINETGNDVLNSANINYEYKG